MKFLFKIVLGYAKKNTLNSSTAYSKFFLLNCLAWTVSLTLNFLKRIFYMTFHFTEGQKLVELASSAFYFYYLIIYLQKIVT